MFWFGFSMARAARRTLVPSRRYSCSNPEPVSAAGFVAILAGFLVGIPVLLAVLHAMASTHTVTPPAPPGWYTGYDGNYHPDGYPIARTQPNPPPASTAATPAATSTPMTAESRNFLIGFVVAFLILIAAVAAAVIGAVKSRRKSPPPRRQPPPNHPQAFYSDRR